MVSPFTQRIIDIIRQIPHGKITTYGIIAEHAGSHRGARQVARILHSSSRKYNLPWHRVVNRQGKISLPQGQPSALQKSKLEAEGIIFEIDDSIDFDTYLWWPDTYISSK